MSERWRVVPEDELDAAGFDTWASEVCAIARGTDLDALGSLYFLAHEADSGYVEELCRKLDAHDALVAALEELVTLKDERPADYDARKPLAWQAARDALAAAKGGGQ